jgi:hypothetical protein
VKIDWTLFYLNYVKAIFNIRSRKAERKEIINEILKIEDNYVVFDDDQWWLWCQYYYEELEK